MPISKSALHPYRVYFYTSESVKTGVAERTTANTVADLIAQVPYQHSPLPRETIKKSLVFFVNKFSNGDVLAFEQLIKISLQSEITQWYSATSSRLWSGRNRFEKRHLA
jgi:hypothetical protein